MYYIVKFKEYPCEQLEGYTDNEFILRQYLKELDHVFRFINYEVHTEDGDLEDILAKYELKKLQKFRSYQSKDETVTVYCSPVMFCDWMGLRSDSTPWSYTNRQKVPSVIKGMTNTALNLTQMLDFFQHDVKEQLYPLVRTLLVTVIRNEQNFDSTSHPSGIDPIKLMVYVNKFPKEVVM